MKGDTVTDDIIFSYYIILTFFALLFLAKTRDFHYFQVKMTSAYEGLDWKDAQITHHCIITDFACYTVSA